MKFRNILLSVSLAACIIIGAFLTYQPHIDNPLPLIADEYVHISLALQLLNEGVLPYTNPYIATPTPHVNYQAGFHFLLAGIFAIAPGDPVVTYQYFATIFFILNALLLFWLVKIWSKNTIAALSAVLFFGTIPSIDGLLTQLFFVPLTLGITLLFTSFIFLHRFIVAPSSKTILPIVAVSILMAVSYPPVLLFFGITTTLFLYAKIPTLANWLHITPKQFAINYTLLLVLLTFIFVAGLLYTGLISAIHFTSAWAIYEFQYSPVWYFGFIPSALALLGIVDTLYSKHTQVKLFLYWFLASLIGLYFFAIFQEIWLIPYPRLFYFYLIGISILAGLGVSALLPAKLLPKTYSVCIPVASILFILLGYHVYTALQTTPQLANIVTEHQFNQLREFKKSHPEPGIFIADPFSSIAIYPLTGKKVVSVLNSNSGGGDSRLAQTFVAADCNTRMELLNEFAPYLQNLAYQDTQIFMLSQHHPTCDFLKKIHNYQARQSIYVFGHYTVAELLRESALLAMATTSQNSVLPDDALVDAASIKAQLAGKTLVGLTWKEYLYDDGRLLGVDNEEYQGVWDVRGSYICFYIYARNNTYCRSVVDTDTGFDFYTPAGVFSSRAQVFSGKQLERPFLTDE